MYRDNETNFIPQQQNQWYTSTTKPDVYRDYETNDIPRQRNQWYISATESVVYVDNKTNDIPRQRNQWYTSPTESVKNTMTNQPPVLSPRVTHCNKHDLSYLRTRETSVD
ncbi:hypothetical protein RRG08_014066 [Elysia crispata]|uniref:Uncharacterized protein n=1 Tax=Elysia crispata TaxID=231223 RepID=A0AAE1DPU0_9GAST|nr:hypothetical protein RRG08_014066 [Elysia crispata]